MANIPAILTFKVALQQPRAAVATLNIGIVHGASADSDGITELQRIFSDRNYSVTTDTTGNWTVSALADEQCLVLFDLDEGETSFRDDLETAGKPIVIIYSTMAGTYSQTTIGPLLGILANETTGSITIGTDEFRQGDDFRNTRISSGYAAARTFTFPARVVAGSVTYGHLASAATTYAGHAVLENLTGLPVCIAADRGVARLPYRGVGNFADRIVYFGAINPDQLSGDGSRGLERDGSNLLVTAIEWAIGEYEGRSFL